MKCFQTVARGFVILVAVLCMCALLVWFVIPHIILGWDLLSPHYNHNVAILSSDVECEIQTEGSESKSVVLPKGLMIFAPCRHDFARMAMDENGIYKIYVKLTPQTINAILKDSDSDFVTNIENSERFQELEEVPKSFPDMDNPHPKESSPSNKIH